MSRGDSSRLRMVLRGRLFRNCRFVMTYIIVSDKWNKDLLPFLSESGTGQVLGFHGCCDLFSERPGERAAETWESVASRREAATRGIGKSMWPRRRVMMLGAARGCVKLFFLSTEADPRASSKETSRLGSEAVLLILCSRPPHSS